MNNSKAIFIFLSILLVALGCHSTTWVGGSSPSPSGRFRARTIAWGTPGKAFSEQSNKKFTLTIYESKSKEVVGRFSTNVNSASLHWKCVWSNDFVLKLLLYEDEVVGESK